MVLFYKDYILGEDPTDVERVMLKIRRLGAFKPWGSAVSAIEIALWDIAGQVAGVPAYKLLGGKVRDRVRTLKAGRRVRMHTVRSAAAALILTFALASPRASAADQFSRYCPKETSSGLGPGTWEGSFEQLITSAGNIGGMTTNFSWTVKGTLKIRVSEATISSLEGKAKVLAAGGVQIAGSVTGTGNVRETEIDLSLAEGDLGTSFFSAAGKLDVELHTNVTPAPDNTSPAQTRTAPGDIRLSFRIDSAECTTSDGSFLWENFAKTEQGLRKAGSTVAKGPAKFHLEHVEAKEYAKDLAQLKADLLHARTPPASLVRTRDKEAQIYGNIAKGISQKTFSDCLFIVWRDFVGRRLAEWIAEDVAFLNTFKGTYGSYQERATRVISGAKSAALLGLDTCNARLQQSAFEAVGNAAGSLMKRMIEGGASIENTLSVLKEQDLLGSISPEAREKVSQGIIKQAEQMYAYRRDQYRFVRRQRLQSKGNPCNPAEQVAFRMAVNAERILALIAGFEGPSIMEFAPEYAKCAASAKPPAPK